MKVIPAILGLGLLGFALVLSFGSIVDASTTGAELEGGAGAFFSVVPQLIGFVVVPIAGVALVVLAWSKLK